MLAMIIITGASWEQGHRPSPTSPAETVVEGVTVCTALHLSKNLTCPDFTRPPTRPAAGCDHEVDREGGASPILTPRRRRRPIARRRSPTRAPRPATSSSQRPPHADQFLDNPSPLSNLARGFSARSNWPSLCVAVLARPAHLEAQPPVRPGPAVSPVIKLRPCRPSSPVSAWSRANGSGSDLLVVLESHEDGEPCPCTQ